MSKTINKVLKIFSIFIFSIVVLGMFIVVIYKNTLQVVDKSPVKSNQVLQSCSSFEGIVKPKYFIEVYANDKIYISVPNVKKTQIIKDKELFRFLSDNNFIDKSQLSVVSQNLDDINNININEKSQLLIKDKIYIDYITDKTMLNKGDLLLRYCYYDKNIYIESKVNKLLFKDIVNDEGEIKVNGYSSVKLKLIDYNEYLSYNEIYLENEKQKSNILGLFNTIKLNLIKNIECEYSVRKSALLIYGELSVGSTGKVIAIVEKDTILGKQNVLYEQQCEITAIGKYNVGIKITDYDNVFVTGVNNIVSLPTSKLKMCMRVRVK